MRAVSCISWIEFFVVYDFVAMNGERRSTKYMKRHERAYASRSLSRSPFNPSICSYPLFSCSSLFTLLVCVARPGVIRWNLMAIL